MEIDFEFSGTLKPRPVKRRWRDDPDSWLNVGWLEAFSYVGWAVLAVLALIGLGADAGGAALDLSAGF